MKFQADIQTPENLKTLFKSEADFKQKWETELNKLYEYKDGGKQGFDIHFSPLCCVIVCLAHDLKLKGNSPLCASLMQILDRSSLNSGKIPTDQSLIPDGKAIELNPLMREALFGTTHKKLMSTGNVEIIHVLRNLTNAFRCGKKGKNPIHSRILSKTVNSDLPIVKSTAHLVEELYPVKQYATKKEASCENVIEDHMRGFIVMPGKTLIPSNMTEKCSGPKNYIFYERDGRARAGSFSFVSKHSFTLEV